MNGVAENCNYIVIHAVRMSVGEKTKAPRGIKDNKQKVKKVFSVVCFGKCILENFES